MDNNIVRWYNKNRKNIWITILTITAILGMIHTLNNYYEKKQEYSLESNESYITHNDTNYSVISQEKIDKEVSQKSVDIIDNFFKYCNNNEIENAYNLLSYECKEELYPTIEEFKQKYYNRIFTENKNYETVLWITSANRNVYRVEIMSDLLATGGKDYMPIEDYYTIIKENENYKLNISSYVGKDYINASKEEDNININVISKEIYMDYEKYEIQIQNNTGNKLIFNNKQNTDSIYIKDENDLQYIAFLNEITSNELEILNGTTKTLEIKFNRGFKPTIDIEEIVFGDIVINQNIKEITVKI